MPVTESAAFDREISEATTGGLKNVFAGGSTTGPISAALFAYHQSVKQNQARAQQGAYLYKVVTTCRTWLDNKTKEKKKDPTKETENTKARKRIIVRVRKEAEAELKENPVIMNICGTQDGIQRAGAVYSAAKSMGSRNDKLVGLKNSYAHERTAYVDMKANAHGQFHDPQMPRFVPSGTLLHGQAKSQGISDEQFKARTYNEYMALDAQLGSQNPVIFLSKMQRLQYLIALEDGQFYSAVDGTLFTSSDNRVEDELVGSATEQCIYACDKYANLFAMPPANFIDKTVDKKPVQTNHSSLTAGKDVLSAGTISIKKGVLRGISNNSGHYAPSTTDLQAYLNVFLEMGVNLTGVVVVDKSKNIITSAVNFLRNDFRDTSKDHFVSKILNMKS